MESPRIVPSVTFFSESSGIATVVEYEPDGTTTVLELARRNELPLEWRCGLGTCGTCAARVIVLEGPVRSMGNRERNVLVREGYEAGPVCAGSSWRLVCGYVLSGETLLVEYAASGVQRSAGGEEKFS
jgi:ferredoxin